MASRGYAYASHDAMLWKDADPDVSFLKRA